MMKPLTDASEDFYENNPEEPSFALIATADGERWFVQELASSNDGAPVINGTTVLVRSDEQGTITRYDFE